MTNWPLQDAEARFSEFLDKCLSDGPETLTRGGKDEAVFAIDETAKRVRRPGSERNLANEISRGSCTAAFFTMYMDVIGVR